MLALSIVVLPKERCQCQQPGIGNAAWESEGERERQIFPCSSSWWGSIQCNAETRNRIIETKRPMNVTHTIKALTCSRSLQFPGVLAEFVEVAGRKIDQSEDLKAWLLQQTNYI